MIDKDAYIKKLEAEIELGQAKLAELKAQAKSKLADGSIEYEKKVAEAEEMFEALKAKLDPALIPPASAAAAPAPTTAAAAPAAAPAAAAAPAPKAAPTPETHVEGEIKVGGSTTFGNLRSWGLSDAEIEKITGVKPLADGDIVRDAVQAAGKSFSEVKTALQVAAEAKKK